MGSLMRGWRLTKTSWGILRADKELAAFTTMGAICTIVAALLFVLPAIVVGSHGRANGPAGIVLLFLFYLVTTIITVYFNTALVAVALDRLRGGRAPMSMGYQVARSKFATIFVFSLVSATVGVLVALIEERFEIVGKIIGSVIGAAWSIATFLVLPVVVAEGGSPFGAIKRSASLLRSTWGEQIGGSTGISLVFLLLALLAAAPIALGALAGGIVLWLGIAIAAVYLGLLFIVASALGQILRSAIYLYAETGQVPAQYDASLIQHAFTAKAA
jgi:Family of unknown function (DUF6159)